MTIALNLAIIFFFQAQTIDSCSFLTSSLKYMLWTVKKKKKKNALAMTASSG